MAFRSVTASLLLASAVALPLFGQSGITAVLPNGRQIRPVGNWIEVAPYPFAIAVKPDGTEAAVPSIGFPFALNVISQPDASNATVRRLPGGDKRENDPSIEVHAGLAYSSDGKTLYVATGNSGKIALYNTADWSQQGEIPLDGQVGRTDFSASFAASVIVSADGHTLYALDQGNWRIVIIDATEKKVIASIPTGRYPFGQALSPDGTHLYVTNIGLFEYSLIAGVKKDDLLNTGLHFAPTGYPSKETREGTTAEGRKIPGLGDENSDFGSSLWTYDVHDREHPTITARLRLGERITEAVIKNGTGTIGSAAPTGVVAGSDAVYVSLAHQDTIAKVSADGTHVLAQAPLTPFTGERFSDS